MELQAPIVPVPDSSALQYVAKGLSGMMANRRYQQQYELAYQKMVQDAALDQEKFKLAREQVANQYEVQQAQIENLHSEANQHNAAAKYTENIRGQATKDNQELLGRVTEYRQKAAELMAGKYGTTEGSNILGLLDVEFPDIGNIRQGAQARSANYTQQAREERNSIATLGNLRKNFDDTAKQSLGRWANDPQIAASPGQLEYDPKTKKFQPNDVWGVNDKSNDPFLTVEGQKDAGGQWVGWKIVPPGKGGKDATYVTIPKSQAESLVTLRDAFRTKASGLAGPPPSTVQAVQQQSTVEQQQNDAIQWVQDNPNDPRAPEIRKRLGLGP